MRNLTNQSDIAVIDAVASVDLHLQLRRALRGHTQVLQFSFFNLFREGVRQFAGVELDHLHAEFTRGIDLFQSWIDKETHANASRVQTLDSGFQLSTMRNHIESAFRCNLFTFFRNEAGFVRHDAQGNIDNSRRVAHFEIQLRHDVVTQPLDIAILNVTTVGPEM